MKRPELASIARQWFEEMRNCGDEVREVLHDGHPTACWGDAAFGYVNVGFFQGAVLKDPARLLEGSGSQRRSAEQAH